MTTERELLELAASAVRLTILAVEVIGGGIATLERGYWHPGRSSADCGELEAVLGLNVEWFSDYIEVTSPDGYVISEYYADHNGNKQNARMWATLRAAAEIGKKQK